MGNPQTGEVASDPVTEDRWRISEFLAGVLSTLLGFGLAVCWDTIKYRREVEHRDNAIIEVMRQEVAENLELVKQDKNLLDQESDYFKTIRTLTPPLSLLKVGAWDLMRVSIPQKMIAEQSELFKIEHMTQAADEINDLIRSRESFRISNSAASNLIPDLKFYDAKLREDFESFAALASQVETELKKE